METLRGAGSSFLHRIIVAGIGPGHPDYMVPEAERAIRQARVLVGGRRALEQFSRPEQTTMAVTRDIPGVLAFVREQLLQEDVVVMVSGDPGYFSMLDALQKEFPKEVLQVIPGISAMQLAFARLALPWHGARLVSFHGRMPKKEELQYEKGRLLGMLTDGDHDSRSIPEILLKEGWPKTAKLAVCARLSYDDEQITETTLGQALKAEPVKHGILILQG